MINNEEFGKKIGTNPREKIAVLSLKYFWKDWDQELKYHESW